MGRCQVLPFCFCSETIPCRFIRIDNTYFVHTNRGRPKSERYTLHRFSRAWERASPKWFRSNTANYRGKLRETKYRQSFVFALRNEIPVGTSSGQEPRSSHLPGANYIMNLSPLNEAEIQRPPLFWHRNDRQRLYPLWASAL